MNDRHDHETKLLTWRWALVVLWGMLLAGFLVRGFFGNPANEIHSTHEGASYVHRVIEFRAALAHGHVSPQWCPDFRSGLGSPFFNYYQPVFFYVAGAIPAAFAPAKVLGMAVWLFAVVGFVGMAALVARFFDVLSGVVAGSLLLLSPYPATELYVRGDLSEFAAMMCLPPLLWGFFACVGSLSRGGWLTTVVAGGLLIATHPCIALPAFGMLGLLSLFFLIDSKTRFGAAAALGGLALGGGVAGFYVLPVFLEIDLVGHEAAFTEYYHYANHFISPLWLLGRYTRETPIPFTIGTAILLGVLLSGAWLAYQHKELDPAQRRILIALLVLALLSIFLMTSLSRVLWENLGLLQRLQFPWRLLAILTVALAGICGPILFGLDRQFRWLAAVVLVGAAFWMSLSYTTPMMPTQFVVPKSAADLVNENIVPDLRNEWLPRDAAAQFPEGIPTSPTATPGVAVDNFQRDHCRLSCTVSAGEDGTVMLPHYYFPVGWRATLDDQSVPLSADQNGLMQIEIPANSSGQLVAEFHMTPARRNGWIVTVAALLIAIVLAGLWERLVGRFRPALNAPRESTAD